MTARAPKPADTDKLRASVVQHLASLDEVEAVQWLLGTLEAAHARVYPWPSSKTYLGKACHCVMQQLRHALENWETPAQEKAAREAEKNGRKP